jgi:hypothetical protein
VNVCCEDFGGDIGLNRPGWPSGRWRKSSMRESRAATVRQAWDLDRGSMSKVLTSMSIRRVDTP